MSGCRRTLVLLFLVVPVCLLPGQTKATPAPPVETVPAAWSNYAHVHRSASAIRLVVVHVTESSFSATVRWFRNPDAHVSANYVVGRNGRVVQMVSDSAVAWHAGNAWVNAHSIGVENEGLVGVDGTFTDTEYRTSARLVASLLRRYGLPADRRHVIGHDQVPDPYHPGRFGGYAHHVDPGVYWDWTRYMRYIRAYRRGVTPPPPLLDVTIPGLALDQRVTGAVAWTAKLTGEPAEQVEFLLDGEPLTTLTAPPYVVRWDSRTVGNGHHELAVRATAAGGASALASVVVTTANGVPPPPLVVDAGIEEGAAVTGLVQLTPTLANGPAGQVELWIDGSVVAVATAPPWALSWDATTATPGQHTLAVRAVGPRGGSTAKIVLVTVVAPPAGS